MHLPDSPLQLLLCYLVVHRWVTLKVDRQNTEAAKHVANHDWEAGGGGAGVPAQLLLLE